MSFIGIAKISLHDDFEINVSVGFPNVYCNLTFSAELLEFPSVLVNCALSYLLNIFFGSPHCMIH